MRYNSGMYTTDDPGRSRVAVGRWGRALGELRSRLTHPSVTAAFAAGTVTIGPAAWGRGGFTPQLTPAAGPLASARELVGWSAGEAAGVFVRVAPAGWTPGVAVVMRDGSERIDPQLAGLAPMLRRSLGLPSGARCRRPWQVAVERMAASVVAVAGAPACHAQLRAAINAGQLRGLPEVRRALGPLEPLLGEDLDWAELRGRAAAVPAAAWCDAAMFGFLCGWGYPSVEESLVEIETQLGAEWAVLVRDQLLGPW